MGSEMADIAKCKGEFPFEDRKLKGTGVARICPVRSKCYRYTATTAKGYQAFLRPNKIGEITEQGCVHFWPCSGKGVVE